MELCAFFIVTFIFPSFEKCSATVNIVSGLTTIHRQSKLQSNNARGYMWEDKNIMEALASINETNV